MAQEMKLSEQEETKGEGWNMEEEIWDSGAKINPPEILECETKTKPKPRVGFDLSKNTSIANNVPDETRDSTAEAHRAGEDFSQADTQPLDSDDDNIKDVDNESKDEFLPAKLIGLSSKMDPSHTLIEITSEVFKMGRTFEANVTIKDINISREQAEFQYKQGQWTIKDNSSNGIRVNGKRISKGVPFTLNFQDEILFSDQTDKYFWKFVSITDKENIDSSNSRKRKLCQGGTDKRLKLDSSSSNSSAAMSRLKEIQKEKILKKIENERIEREKFEKLMQQERLEREKVEKKMEEERQERERIMKQMEEERKERAILTLQLREQKLANDTERVKLESEMENMKVEKDRIEAEQRRAMEELQAKEEQTREEMRRKEEENKEKQELIFKQIQEEKEKASSTAEEREKKIAELVKAMAAAKEEAAAIILQEVEEKQRISEEMTAEKQRIEEEKLKYENEMTALRAEKERVEVDNNRKVAEALAAQAAKDEELRRKEEEITAKQQEIMDQIETEKARAATSEEENKLKESRIKELEQEMSNTEEEANKIKEQGAQEVLEKMGDTLEQQLICPTCLELPIHPIILNCGHSYCWLCLQQWKKMSSKSLCPQCRVLITVETRGISMDNMIEAIISQLGPTKMEERKRMVEMRCAEEQKFRDTGSSVNNKGGGRQANNRNRRGGNRAGNTAPDASSGSYPTPGGSGANSHQGANNRGGPGNRGRGSGHNYQRGSNNNQHGRGGGHNNQHIRGDGHNVHNNRGRGSNNRNQGHRLGGPQNINPFFTRQPFAPMNNYTIPRNQPHQLGSNYQHQAQQLATQHQVRPHNIRHIVVLDSSGNNRVTVPVVSGGQNIQVYTTAAGVVSNISSITTATMPQSNRSAQILNFGDALAARAAAVAQNSVLSSSNNPVTVANRLTAGCPVITAAAQAATTSSHQPTTRQGLAAANRQFSVLGGGSLADNVAGEVVVNTSAPGPSGGGGGGSGNAAAGAEPILVDSDSDDNSDENSDDSLSSLNSQDSDDSLNSQDFPDYDSDASDVEGLPGYYYGGYGHCYACGRGGHWAPGCPF